MSSPNLLSATTVNFQELVGNRKSFKVPPYQRDYSWTEEQWEDLWLDILEQRSEPQSRHCMGAIVVKAEDDRNFLIIDGQQRIATLTIIGLAVIDALLSLKSESEDNALRASVLRARFIGEKDPASLAEISKLALNERDNGFFQDYLGQLRPPLSPKSLTKSNKLLYDCFKYYQSKIRQAEDMPDGKSLAGLLSEVVARQLLFILISVDDEINAYTVFEILNARGLELTVSDLLKNYLFSRVRTASDLEAAQRRWSRIIATVRQDRFGSFLRYHYLTKFQKIRSGRLFKIVRDEVRDATAVFELIKSLEARAELFEALSDENHSLWADRTDAKPYVEQLGLFRVQQMTPLLFAAFEKFSPSDFVRVLKLVVVISFRYTVVSGLSTGDLEVIYHRAAKAILDGTVDTPRGVFQQLEAAYTSDSKFEVDFSELSLHSSNQRKLAKYILIQLENGYSESSLNWTTDPGSVEHIFPENPSGVWEESITADERATATYRLGNLTLLKASVNRDLGNASYPDKIAAYEDSNYLITRRIPEMAPTEWTLALINKRQREMAEMAKKVWRADFA